MFIFLFFVSIYVSKTCKFKKYITQLNLKNESGIKGLLPMEIKVLKSMPDYNNSVALLEARVPFGWCHCVFGRNTGSDEDGLRYLRLVTPQSDLHHYPGC